jgi:hypothetical protein
MDDLINGVSNVDNLEGQPISPEGMGIQETSIGGAEISDTSIRPETETGSVVNLSPDVSGFATGLDTMLDTNPNLGIQEVANVNPDAPLPEITPADLRAELGEVFNPALSKRGYFWCNLFWSFVCLIFRL